MSAEETTASLVDQVMAEGVAGRTVAVQLHGFVDEEQLARLRAAGASVVTVAPYRWTTPAEPRGSAACWTPSPRDRWTP